MPKWVIIISAIFALTVTTAFSQLTYTSAKAGLFSLGSTWSGGVVPPSGSNIVVNHAVTVSSPVSVKSINISKAGSLIINADMSIAGDVSNYGGFFSSAKLSFVGKTLQNVINYNGVGKFYNSSTKPTASFNSVEFNNPTTPIAVKFNFGDGIRVDGAIMFNGLVTFTNGIVDIGTDNQFLFSLTGTAKRVNGGVLRGYGPGGGAQMGKQYPAGASSFTYYIYDNYGTYEYTPVTVSLSSNSFSGKMVAINVTDNTHPKIKLAGAPVDYISRYWRVVATPIGTHTASISFSYLSSDIIGSESKMQFNSWNSTAWTQKKSLASTNVLTINGINEKSFSGTLCEVTALTDRTLQAARASVFNRDIAADAKVSVYPNPVRSGGKVNVNFANVPAGKYNLTVYNNAGQLLYSSVSEHAGGFLLKSVDLPATLPQGTYRLIVTDGMKKITQKSLLIEN